MPFMVRWMVRSEREITRKEHEALLALADREAAKPWRSAGFTLEVMGGAGVIAVGIVAMPKDLEHADWPPLLASLTALRLTIPGSTVEISGEESLIVWEAGLAQYQIAKQPDPPVIPPKLARQILERSDTEPGTRGAQDLKPRLSAQPRASQADPLIEPPAPQAEEPVEPTTNRFFRSPSTTPELDEDSIWHPLELVRPKANVPVGQARSTRTRRSALFKLLSETEVSGFQLRAAQFRIRAVGYLAEGGEVLLERMEDPPDPLAAFPAGTSPVRARASCRVVLEESFGLELGLELCLIAPALSSVPIDVAVVFRAAGEKILGRELFSWDLPADATACFGRLLFDLRCAKADRLEVVVRGGRFAKAQPAQLVKAGQQSG